MTKETIKSSIDEGRGFGAKSLPASTMSQAMERRLRTRVFSEAREQGIDRASASNFLNSITIRCLAGSDRNLKRWKRMRQWIEVQSKAYFDDLQEKERLKFERKLEIREEKEMIRIEKIERKEAREVKKILKEKKRKEKLKIKKLKKKTKEEEREEEREKKRRKRKKKMMMKNEKKEAKKTKRTKKKLNQGERGERLAARKMEREEREREEEKEG